VLDDTFPTIPERPTASEARTALDRLAYPLRGFPFVDEAARSVALAAMLTALVRASLRTAPLHGFDAPTAGTGKSLLAELAGLLATGCRPPALSQGKTAEEDEKRLSTVLFAGDSVIHLDNCERPIAGDFLCSMLTQEIVQARILGLSERRVLPSTALVLASGNNLTFAGDASRRAVVCRLDAGVERPDTREFDFDCHADVLAARGELVVAGLTILRAYVVAGRPVRLTPMGSFTDWEWIRGALVWLECADPADTRSTILDNDPKRDELVTVMDAWEAALGSASVDVGEIAKRADEAEGLKRSPNPQIAMTANTTVLALRDALAEAACRNGTWNTKSIGWFLRRHKDRVVSKRAFRCVFEGKQQQWRLDGATEPGLPFDAARVSEGARDWQPGHEM
jgi:putative DNA primase/helicase